MEWKYDSEKQAYLCENERDGCEVFFYQNKWTGNVVFGGYIEGIEDFDTKEEAMKSAIEKLNILRKELA